jgi:hypothetical protein
LSKFVAVPEEDYKFDENYEHYIETAGQRHANISTGYHIPPINPMMRDSSFDKLHAANEAFLRAGKQAMGKEINRLKPLMQKSASFHNKSTSSNENSNNKSQGIESSKNNNNGSMDVANQENSIKTSH